MRQYELNAEAFRDWLSRSPRLQANHDLDLARRLARVVAQQEITGTLSLRNRLVHCLAELAARLGLWRENGQVVLPFRLTQGELASLCSASREAVNRVIARIMREGDVGVAGNGHFVVPSSAVELFLKSCIAQPDTRLSAQSSTHGIAHLEGFQSL